GGFEQQVTAAGIPMSSRGQGAFQTLSHGEFFNKESDTACMLSLDTAKRIDEKNPGGLIGKNLTLLYASSKKSDATTDAALGFQVQRRDMECPIIGIVEREAGPAIPLGGGGF